MEYGKASVEFSKLLVTNLHLINAGGLLATPTIAKFLGYEAMRPAIRVAVLTTPPVLFLAGLLCAAGCALSAYVNFQKHARSQNLLRDEQLLAIKTHFPLLPDEKPYTMTAYHADLASIRRVQAKNDRAIQKTYRLGISFGLLSLLFFSLACGFYGLVLLWPTLKPWLVTMASIF
jgi:hypothetical protein